MDQVQAMQVFVRIVDGGSFSQAGREMGMGPSTVSRIIGDLEEGLDTRLFNRTTRKLSLTEAGEVYLGRVRGILFDLEEARLELSNLTEKPSGVLRLTVPTGLGRELLISALPLFQEKYPAVKVVLTMTDHVLDVVEAGFDVAIRLGRLSDSSLIARKIGTSRRIVCASPDYLEKHRAPKTPEALRDHNCLTWREQPGFNNWIFQKNGVRSAVQVTGSLFSKNADVLVASAVAGMGIVLLPVWNMANEFRQKNLCPVLKTYAPIPAESPVYAVYPSQRQLSPKVRVFIDFLVTHFASHAV